MSRRLTGNGATMWRLYSLTYGDLSFCAPSRLLKQRPADTTRHVWAHVGRRPASLPASDTCATLTGVYTDEALRAADQPAGPVLRYTRVRQLSLPAVVRLASLGVETHFRDEWFGPLAAPWMVHQHHTPTTGLWLGGGWGDACYTRDEHLSSDISSKIVFCSWFNTNELSCHLMVSVEEQADGAVGGLLAHPLVVLPLCLRVVRPTLPQLGERLRPLLLLLLLHLHVHIHICWHGGGTHRTFRVHCRAPHNIALHRADEPNSCVPSSLCTSLIRGWWRGSLLSWACCCCFFAMDLQYDCSSDICWSKTCTATPNVKPLSMYAAWSLPMMGHIGSVLVCIHLLTKITIDPSRSQPLTTYMTILSDRLHLIRYWYPDRNGVFHDDNATVRKGAMVTL